MSNIIICLGNTFSNKQKIESMKLRVETAVKFYKQKNSKIIFTGGFKTNKNISEAQFMSEYAKKQGVKNIDIILEEKSNTTLENALYCKDIIKNNFDSILIITSPYHLKRTKYIFEKTIPNKNLIFKACKNNLNFWEKIIYFIKENYYLSKLKRDN